MERPPLRLKRRSHCDLNQVWQHYSRKPVKKCATRLEFLFCSFSRFPRHCSCAELVSWALPHAQRFRLKNWRLWGKTRDESDFRGHSFRGSTYMKHICLSLTGVDWVKLYKRSSCLMLLGSEGNCDTCKSFIKGLLNKMRQHFQKFLLSSLTLRRLTFAVNGPLGAPFANFVQKRASYSTFTYIPKSLFPCRLKLVSEETGIAPCKRKIWLNKFLTWRFIWLPKLMQLNLATVNRDSKASSARPEIAAIHKSCSPSLIKG